MAINKDIKMRGWQIDLIKSILNKDVKPVIPPLFFRPKQYYYFGAKEQKPETIQWADRPDPTSWDVKGASANLLITDEVLPNNSPPVRSFLSGIAYGGMDIYSSPFIKDERRLIGHHINIAHPAAFAAIRVLRWLGFKISPWAAFPMISIAPSYYRIGGRLVTSPMGADMLAKTLRKVTT